MQDRANPEPERARAFDEPPSATEPFEAWPAEDRNDAPPTSRRALVGAVAGFVSVLGLALLAVMPAPYTSSAPGPTFDTLGETSSGPLIQVEGSQTFASSGELRLTTVSFAGSRERNLDLVTVLRGWASPSVTIDPVERFFPEPDDETDRQEQSRQEMTSSQENATVAALTELGIEVPATITVVEAIEGTGAVGVLLPGDVITAIDGSKVVTYRDMSEALLAAGAGSTVTVGVLRDGAQTDVDVVSGERPDGSALLGVWVDPEFDFPFDVTIQVDDVGGPSAGTMFALGLLDLLTPEDEVAGNVIAGTGTIDLDGQVGAISGIRQKMIGAVRDGATSFLAPVGNCDAVRGNVPAGLEVFAMSTLAEARTAVEAIGAGQTAGLPTC
ncbi:MAG: PDZ domain-containing protein [Actinomycetota bacterium]|nr:PDZ domain-containing protein [Actinomycetota bacterium]